MKNYKRGEAGGAERIADKFLLEWKLNGSFPPGENLALPMKLAPEDVSAISPLLDRDENFVFWFTNDFRIVFVTRDGSVSSSGKWWRLRFEWRARTAAGKTAASMVRADKALDRAAVLPAIENAIPQLTQMIMNGGQPVPPSPSAPGPDT